MRKGARESAPERKKTDLWGAHGCQKVFHWTKMDPKWRQMGAQKVPKIEVMQKSAECGLDPLFTIYSHYRHPPKPHFLTPRSNQNASLFCVVPRMPPRGCKMALPGPKNGETGVPRDPQGCRRGSQCFPKCSQKSSQNQHPLQDCLQGCSRGALGTLPPPKYSYFCRSIVPNRCQRQ